MAQGKKEEAEEVKKEVAASGARIDELSAREKEVEEKIKTIMMTIPNIIDQMCIRDRQNDRRSDLTPERKKQKISSKKP